ncbi:MAG: succinate dehydrogenase/fumarate reductase iron-sulfur subunit [Bacteroidales bacterium]|nr:succinate dehydrogenase/fumarate reductase iron-sulfur subunit [Bacteroidales bacterium]
MDFNIKVWRQSSPKAIGRFETYFLSVISPDISFVEMMDNLNKQLSDYKQDVIAFDHDCREGICGACSLYINGYAHGPDSEVTTCQLYMRMFRDGSTITVEPWRSRGFPIIKDLVVDRQAFDKILQAGGFVSVDTGGAPDANTIPIAKIDADKSLDASSCIGCGACVAACKNGSAMLFIAARTSALSFLPQGSIERAARAKAMVKKMDELGFGTCCNTGACALVCPKKISIEHIARLNRDFLLFT